MPEAVRELGLGRRASTVGSDARGGARGAQRGDRPQRAECGHRVGYAEHGVDRGHVRLHGDREGDDGAADAVWLSASATITCWGPAPRGVSGTSVAAPHRIITTAAVGTEAGSPKPASRHSTTPTAVAVRTHTPRGATVRR